MTHSSVVPGPSQTEHPTGSGCPLTWVTLSLLLTAVMTMALSAQTLTTLVSFNGSNGASPRSGLIQGTDGNLYGTTLHGGTSNNGTVFRITPGGALTTLYSFCTQPGCTDGALPVAGLVQGTDGDFYGTTVQNGEQCCGTVFRITPGGSLTTLHSFNGADGSEPTGTLVQASDGNFYGTTFFGGSSLSCGSSGCGTVFKMTPTGTLTTLHGFDSHDGLSPLAGLVQSVDGDLYGTTSSGGANGAGTVFSIAKDGTLTVLHSFNSADGGIPIAPLIQASDGQFYGTTANLGAHGNGTVFKITAGGTLTTLHNFDLDDGANPYSSLLQASDGNLYGATYAGGVSGNCHPGCGTIFRITTSGTLTTLHSFSGAEGLGPSGGVVQATDGNLYGTTFGGGAGGNGTIFQLAAGLRPFVKTQPSIGPVGTPVTILGSNLDGATNVIFNGTAAPFHVVSAGEITANVPPGATSGIVQVSLPGGPVRSSANFEVVGPLQFVPVTPCRLVDTRQTGGPIQGGSSRNFFLAQIDCEIPASAAAFSLNITVIPQATLGYLTIWPQGDIQPYTSMANSQDGRVKANAAIVPSANDGVSVYVSDTANVILDVNGYFTAGGPDTYAYYPLPPCRLVDTRNGQDGGTLQAGAERDYNIAGKCGIPNTATAYSFNVTAIPPSGGLDYLTVWPEGQPMPGVSTLNDPTGTIVANAAIIPAGPNNATAFVAHNNRTDLLVDVNGYFAPPGPGGLSLHTQRPCRVLDTRQSGNGFSGKIAVDVAGSTCAPLPSAEAYVLNATVVPPGPLPYLTLWPDGTDRPIVSTLNASDGAITTNMAIVSTNNGSIDAYAAALTQLILDISGYFAP